MNHLTEAALAARLSVSRRTLQKWRASGDGPPFMRLGGAIRYNVEDVERWEQQQKRGLEDAGFQPSLVVEAPDGGTLRCLQRGE